MSQYDLLFADQPLEELLLDVEFPPGGKLEAGRARMWEGNPQDTAKLVAGGDEPWASFLIAQARKATGQSPTKELRGIAENAFRESRVRLWAWTALRALGEKPALMHANEVLGIVAEVPVDGGLDVLATYSDGSARYLGHADQLIVLEPSDGPTSEAQDAHQEAFRLLSVPPQPRDKKAPAPEPDHIRITALSAQGLHRIEIPESEVEPGTEYGKLFRSLTKVLAQVTQIP